MLKNMTKKREKLMSKEEVVNLLKFLDNNYQGFFKDRDFDGMVKDWLDILCKYDGNEVKDRLERIMKDPYFQSHPPTAYGLVSGLTKIGEKIDWNKAVYYCDLCNKAFNDYDEMMKHRRRENSIEYITHQRKRWWGASTNRKELFAMDQEKFDEEYMKLLHYIYDHTGDSEEKIRIGYIFNPPGQREAQNFLNKTNERLQDEIIYQ